MLEALQGINLNVKFFFQNLPKLFIAGEEAASFELKNWIIDFWPGECRKFRFTSLTLEHSNFGSNPEKKKKNWLPTGKRIGDIKWKS